MTYCSVPNALEHFAAVTKEVTDEDPINKFNLGKLMFAAWKRIPKYATFQIDAATGQEESYGSVMERCVRTAQAFRKLNIQVGDSICIMGRNHLDIIIPFYASMFVGAAVFGLDMYLKRAEHRALLAIGKPKIVFCEIENVPTIMELQKNFNYKIVTFTKMPESDIPSFAEFLNEYYSTETVEEFKPTKFDPATTTCLACCTSGSTGLPKLADITHANITPLMAYFWTADGPATNLSEQVRIMTTVAPVYWFTMKLAHILTAIYGVCKLQSSAKLSPEVMINLINRYRPHMTCMTPGMAMILLKNAEKMDWTSMHTFLMAGSACTPEVIDSINALIGKKAAINAYGLTEASGRVFWKNENIVGSLGELIPTMQARVVDIKTGEEAETGKAGELWIKGPNVCRGYFNDPDNTVGSFTPDGWFKTGDLVYKDDNSRYFYLDRLRSMLNTVSEDMQYHISPVEIENEVKRMQGVNDAVVTGIKIGDLDLPMAVVVKKNGAVVTAEEVVEYIKVNMSKAKHLTGGVMFVDSLPLLSAGKIDRLTIRRMANEEYKKRQH